LRAAVRDTPETPTRVRIVLLGAESHRPLSAWRLAAVLLKKRIAGAPGWRRHCEEASRSSDERERRADSTHLDHVGQPRTDTGSRRLGLPDRTGAAANVANCSVPQQAVFRHHSGASRNCQAQEDSLATVVLWLWSSLLRREASGMMGAHLPHWLTAVRQNRLTFFDCRRFGTMHG
jgi:hypothetical protein